MVAFCEDVLEKLTVVVVEKKGRERPGIFGRERAVDEELFGAW